MPYQRKTLSQLRAEVAADITSGLPGTDGLLRFANLQILGRMLAGLIHEEYGYSDWIAKQAVPFTATEEFLEGWAALKNILRQPAAPAVGTVTFTGTAATIIPAGTGFTRADGYAYTVDAEATVGGGGTVTTAATAVLPPIDPVSNPTGSGANGNCDAGTAFTLSNAIAGVQSAAVAATEFTGGANVETDTSLRSRMLLQYQNPPQGGDVFDYVEWARQVPGVTRAWCMPNGSGVGTVNVFFMMDVSEAIHDGFPQGTDGAATQETRASTATGDQLAVANYIFELQPVTALVRAIAPTPHTINFTINGISTATAETKAAIAAALAGVFVLYGTPGGVFVPVGSPPAGSLDISYFESAIAAIPGTAGFILTAPAANVSSADGALPVLGSIVYT